MKHKWDAGRCIACGARPDWPIAKTECPVTWDARKRKVRKAERVSRYIKAGLKAAGLKQADVARKAFMSYDRMLQLTSGKLTPTHADLANLAHTVPSLSLELMLEMCGYPEERVPADAILA